MADATTPVREGMGFNSAALDAWLTEKMPGFAGPVQIAQFSGGQSNPTYRLTTPSGSYVLRRKPPGPLLKGAHDVMREARVMQALDASSVPVPSILAVCDDADVIGTPFFVMELVVGRIFWDAAFRELPIGDRAAYFDAMNATMAKLHSVDPTSIGLGDYGRAGNYFERQIARWTRQYQDDTLAGRNPDMDALVEWLPTAIPHDEETRIVHGDFRCDNLIFHPDRPEVLAILDWELSTLGHPLADFAYHAMMYRVPGDIVAGLGGLNPSELGLPDESAYVAAYCNRTGRLDIDHWDFYIAFNLFRLAAIFHGIKGRVLRGNAVSTQANERASNFPRLAVLAREAMERCGYISS